MSNVHGGTVNVHHFHTPPAKSWRRDGTTIVADVCLMNGTLSRRKNGQRCTFQRTRLIHHRPSCCLAANDGQEITGRNIFFGSCIWNYAINRSHIISLRRVKMSNGWHVWHLRSMILEWNFNNEIYSVFICTINLLPFQISLMFIEIGCNILVDIQKYIFNLT